MAKHHDLSRQPDCEEPIPETRQRTISGRSHDRPAMSGSETAGDVLTTNVILDQCLYATDQGSKARVGTPYVFSAGDLVAFRFPRREGPASYARPCLVLEADEDEILLVYGTTARTAANRGHELAVGADHLTCGLDKPTRFVGARRIRVRHDDPRIEPCPQGGAPIIGSLTEDHTPRLVGILQAIELEHPDNKTRKEMERAGIHPPSGKASASQIPMTAVEVVVRPRRARFHLHRRRSPQTASLA